VRLRLEKEYYYPLDVDTTLTITKKQVNAQYLYNASYVFNNQSYLNDNLVVLPEGLSFTRRINIIRWLHRSHL